MKNKIFLSLCYIFPLINVFNFSVPVVFFSLFYCSFIYKMIGKNNLQLKEHSSYGIKIIAVLIAVWALSAFDISWFDYNFGV